MWTAEMEIIDRIEKMPKTEFGDYLFTKSLHRVIAETMHYPITTFYWGFTFAKLADMEKTEQICRNMEKRGIIKTSKTGMMFKYLGARKEQK